MKRDILFLAIGHKQKVSATSTFQALVRSAKGQSQVSQISPSAHSDFNTYFSRVPLSQCNGLKKKQFGRQ
jgi:hypothetical protein